jgi:hypothetical protein
MIENPYQPPSEIGRQRARGIPWWLSWFAAPFVLGLTANAVLVLLFKLPNVETALFLVNLPAFPVAHVIEHGFPRNPMSLASCC